MSRRSLALLVAAFLAPVTAAAAPAPIIDMHLHVRAARYAGDNPPPMCTPFEVMPRSDPKHGIYEGMAFNRAPRAKPVRTR